MPSILWQSDRHGQGICEEVFAEDRETDLRLLKVPFLSVAAENHASVFDIVTVEGDGCSAAGWEEMSRGTRNRKQMVFLEMTGIVLGF